MAHSNALMATSSLDRITATTRTYRDPSYNIVTDTTLISQPYNNFKVQTLGGNIIQGQVNKIRVAEVMFPYDIPTVITGKNDALAFLVVDISANGDLSANAIGITIPPGFYTGSELATAVSLALPVSMADLTVADDPISKCIYMANSGVWDPSGNNKIFIPFATPGSISPVDVIDSPSLLWTMGFRNLYGRLGFPEPGGGWPFPPILPATLALVPENYPNVAPVLVFPADRKFQAIVGSPYMGLYTQYIDICSPSLCQAQYVRDGNTNQTIVRRDLIARVYISNETSTNGGDPVGTRPFIIHRQFKNPKIMKWTAERSIDSIDLTLYDQYGQPIANSPAIYIADISTIPVASIAYSGARDFAITFLVDEHDMTLSPNLGYTA